MRTRVTTLSLTIAVVAALGFGLQAAPALGAVTDACKLITKSKLESILGLGHIEEHDRLGHSYPSESDGMVHATCYGSAYSGATPTNLAQAKRKLADGSAAEFGWTTYGPDLGAPANDLEAYTKPNGGFERALLGTVYGPREIVILLNYITQHNGHTFTAPKLGAETHDGFQDELTTSGVLKHVSMVGAAWSTESTYSICEVVFVQGKNGSALRKKIERFAKIVVPAAGL
jgi:hypothetical protein